MRKEKPKAMPFSGTKSKIFEDSIELFSQYSYESVSMRDIAGRANIRTSSIYNHFSSKEAILNEMFDYYLMHFNKQCSILESSFIDYEKESVFEIISKSFLYYDYEVERNIVKIVKIIFDIKSRNERANEIFYEVLICKNKDIFRKNINKMIEIKKIKPCDVECISNLLIEMSVYGALQTAVGAVVDEMDWDKKVALFVKMFDEYE